MSTIRIIPTTTTYCHYDRQTAPQPSYVELDCGQGTLSASYNGEMGNAAPMDVYHGHSQRWGIPALTPAAADDLMTDLLPLAERIIAGYTSEWDGNNNVARFTPDAQTAIEEIDRWCSDLQPDEADTMQEIDAGDWLVDITYTDTDGQRCKWQSAVSADIAGYGVITAATTDDQLADMAAAIESDLEKNTEILHLSKFLETERQYCRDNAE